ncbi:NADH-quinone oxidoreductase subunit K [Coralloluteibacterium thermophilus]|uniref:NADH-quinone oxidoreductase subunit K n=1 Tax=Coralloluteibacterium thermophilum TaxID=2707049 RepID=A0ABV9NKZ0_9GAMM
MSQATLYVLAAAAIIGAGVHGLLTAAHLMRKLLCLNLLGGGVFLLLVALAGRSGEAPDPVPQALVLTGIVVAVSMTAFALGLLDRLARVAGDTRLDVDDDDD